MVGAHSLPARILANVVVWSILVFGFLFLVAFKDYTIGFELSILTLGKISFDTTVEHCLIENCSSCCSPAWYQGNCVPMDIRVCDHVGPYSGDSGHRNSRSSRSGGHGQARR